MASAMATSELEAAIAALPAKKRRLRESFDRLVATSPIPIPFTWADVDAHFSSLHSSIAARFRQLQSLPALPTTTHPVEKEDEEEVDGGRPNPAPSDLTADEEEGEQVSAERAIQPSPDQDDAVEEGEASPALEPEEEENATDTIMAHSSHRHGEAKEKAAAPSSRPAPDPAGGADGAARRDLEDMLYWGNKRSARARREFLPTLLGAAEPHALVVGAVGDFLARAEPKRDRHWENCDALLCCVPGLTAEPSAGTLERANRLAEDWREMIVGRTESFERLGRLAVWGLLQFLVSYRITLQLDAHGHGIIHLLVDVPDNKRESCIELCNCLGLTHAMTESVDRLIENGQQFDALKLACALNLTDRYPPLSLMDGYVDKAKKTAQEILGKESESPESLSQAMTEQVNELIVSWWAVDEYEDEIDLVDLDGVKAEITQLLHEYARRRQSLSDASSSSSSAWDAPQQQQQLPTPEEQQQQQQPLKQRGAHAREWSGEKVGQCGKRKRNCDRRMRVSRVGAARVARQHRFHDLPPRWWSSSRGGGGGGGGSSAYDRGDRRGQRFPGVLGPPPPRYPTGPCY